MPDFQKIHLKLLNMAKSFYNETYMIPLPLSKLFEIYAWVECEKVY